MLDLEVVIEQDPTPQAAQTIAQVDVFHAGERSVEAAGGLENMAAHGPAAGPEGGRLPAPPAVDVAVHEVAVLGEEVGRLGGIVVAAEHRVEGRVLVEMAANALEGVGLDANVGVDEDEDLPGAGGGAGVACRGGAAVAAGTDHPGAETARHGRGPVGGAVVNHDALVGLHGRGDERLQARPYRVGGVVSGDDDGKRRFLQL